MEQWKQGNKGTKRESGAFAPPSLDEVTSYCRERGNGIDAEHFVDYYQARGWQLAKGQPMKDWKACVREWEKREVKRSEKVVPVNENPFLRMLREREEAKEE